MNTISLISLSFQSSHLTDTDLNESWLEFVDVNLVCGSFVAAFSGGAKRFCNLR